ncbi:hypothetical protein AMAG_20272 [Allomyces macrogynus ATCC 38327]|uniref:Helicase ATP-binding domain-containing protein n=1 Tax=Allomyces macrogynus (strain ATCC 38327) TaxID=578462 RepID=A0A0L0T8I2_ALLM3|nr:hypothetical protein AMAG_20272 [Allomyces macrogynus ATCC 38327]|eukprot:KNE71001.1 hypothetical protein AMAG_20272 [Allomyces macrogynus ATCC 38327]
MDTRGQGRRCPARRPHGGRCLVKWRGLPISAATWETRATLGCESDPQFDAALARFHDAQRLDSLLRAQPKELDGIGELKPYQVDGLNWLLCNWCARTSCVLAGEMGLGKTVQIVAFVQYLVTRYMRYPALVVAPNSTLEHWDREFRKWAPNLHVVLVPGTAQDRDLTLEHEVFTDARSASVKCHVVIASYEAVIAASRFRNVHWDVLIVDEGHRLKNDASKLFERLAVFAIDHPVLATGTPLAPSNVDVALPPRAELLVPVRMTALQRALIRDIYSQNGALLAALGHSPRRTGGVGSRSASVQNVFVQCRKVLSHP